MANLQVGHSGRELPKAYLRMDPDIDQKHPDNLADFVRLMCASARQRPRGRFANRAVIDAMFGRATVIRFLARGDVVVLADGSLYTTGWDEWQEGDMTVAERVRRTRQRKSIALQSRYADVTQSFPEPLLVPLPPSPVSKSLSESTEGESVPSLEPLMEVIAVIERISGRVWSFRPGSWAWETLEPDVRDFGAAKVIQLMEAVDIPHPDGAELVKSMHYALHPLGSVKPPKAPVEPRVNMAEELRKRRHAQRPDWEE